VPAPRSGAQQPEGPRGLALSDGREDGEPLATAHSVSGKFNRTSAKSE
jgi:hypothetical protein